MHYQPTTLVYRKHLGRRIKRQTTLSPRLRAALPRVAPVVLLAPDPDEHGPDVLGGLVAVHVAVGVHRDPGLEADEAAVPVLILDRQALARHHVLDHDPELSSTTRTRVLDRVRQFFGLFRWCLDSIVFVNRIDQLKKN